MKNSLKLYKLKGVFLMSVGSDRQHKLLYICNSPSFSAQYRVAIAVISSQNSSEHFSINL